MLTPSCRRTTILLLLVAVLAAPWASFAAGPRAESARVTHSGHTLALNLVDRLWSFLRNAWSKEGCRLDPNGLCATNTAQQTSLTKEGCGIDPDGLCHTSTAQPAPPTKTGCHIGPNGQCLP